MDEFVKLGPCKKCVWNRFMLKIELKMDIFDLKKTVYCANVHLLCFMQELGKSELKVKYLLKELVPNFILKVVPSPLKILLSNEN